MSTRIAVLVTCFNRYKVTLVGLEALYRMEAEVDIAVYLLDDGSADDTAAHVRSHYPKVRVYESDGGFYWAGGMRKMWDEAIKSCPDFLLLWNDDTLLHVDALSVMLDVYANSLLNEAVVVGAISDSSGREMTYGGVDSYGKKQQISNVVQECASFNANVALIPRAVYEKYGGLDSRYTHGMADFDYGYRLNKQGVVILQTPNYIGSCDSNSEEGTWRDRSLGRFDRWKLLVAPKSLPVDEWFVYCYRHMGALWPLKFASPYLKVILGF